MLCCDFLQISACVFQSSLDVVPDFVGRFSVVFVITVVAVILLCLVVAFARVLQYAVARCLDPHRATLNCAIHEEVCKKSIDQLTTTIAENESVEGDTRCFDAPRGGDFTGRGFSTNVY